MKYDQTKAYLFIHNTDGDIKISTNSNINIEIIELKEGYGYSQIHIPTLILNETAENIINKDVVILPEDFELEINHNIADILYIAIKEKKEKKYPIFLNLSKAEKDYIVAECNNLDKEDYAKAQKHITSNSFSNKVAKMLETFHDLFI